MEYALQLVEVKIKQHQVTAMHLICALGYLLGGAILALFSASGRYCGIALVAIGLFVGVATVTRNKWVTAPGTNRIFRWTELTIALTMVVYSLAMNWKFPMSIYTIMGIVLVFSLYLERTGNNIQWVRFSDWGIQMPFQSRKRALLWEEVDAVLLRFGTLSIQGMKNTLYQWNVASFDFKADEFEAACKACIEAGKQKRLQNDW